VVAVRCRLALQRQARCGSCRRTQVLLPSWCAPRRADAIEVIGTAAAMALAGAGYGRIGAGLGVPAATVRGCLRRLRCRAKAMRRDAMRQLGFRRRARRSAAARAGRLNAT
jgi:hypothetical protein